MIPSDDQALLVSRVPVEVRAHLAACEDDPDALLNLATYLVAVRPRLTGRLVANLGALFAAAGIEAEERSAEVAELRAYDERLAVLELGDASDAIALADFEGDESPTLNGTATPAPTEGVETAAPSGGDGIAGPKGAGGGGEDAGGQSPPEAPAPSDSPNLCTCERDTTGDAPGRYKCVNCGGAVVVEAPAE